LKTTSELVVKEVENNIRTKTISELGAKVMKMKKYQNLVLK
jgi:hypothetical protein